MKKKESTFRALLLTKCQTEFQKNLVFQNLHEKKKELEAEWAEDVSLLHLVQGISKIQLNTLPI